MKNLIAFLFYLNQVSAAIFLSFRNISILNTTQLNRATVCFSIFVCFLVLTISGNPGVLPRSKFFKQLKGGKNLIACSKNILLNENIFQVKFCKSCRTWRPKRTSHCSLCNYCILTFDHHCPWIKTCIGFGNYKAFVSFISFVSWYFFLCFFGKTNVLNFKKVTGKRNFFVLKITKHCPSDLVFFVFLYFIFLTAIPFFVLLTWFHFYLNFQGLTASEVFKITRKPFWTEDTNGMVFIRFKINKKSSLINSYFPRKYQILLRKRK